MADERSSQSSSKSVDGLESPPTKRFKINGTEEEDISNENGSVFCLSPVEKALQNTLVLQNIFKFLFYDDLQVCRSVDLPFWSSEAEHAISQHPILNIKSGYPFWDGSSQTMVKMFQGKRTQVEYKSISELSSELETREKGSEIWLTVDWLVFSVAALTELQEFLKKFAKQMSNLTLSFHTWTSMPLRDLQKMLRKLQNLSHLHLAGSKYRMSSRWKNDGSDPSSRFIPQVKSISFGSGYGIHLDFLKNLFQVMPNLNNIYNFPLDCIPDSVTDNQLKLDKIRTFNLSCLSSNSDMCKKEDLLSLKKISPEIDLKAAHLCLTLRAVGEWKAEWKSRCESLSKILENNKSTLEYLKIEPFVLPEMLEYPEMEAVKKLHLLSPKINYKPGQVFKFFKEDFDVGRTFPNLVQVNLEGCDTLAKILKLLPKDAGQDYFQGLTTLSLKFRGLLDTKGLEKIAVLFPHVQVLTLTMKGIFHQYQLDPVFTGISKAKCNKLRKHKEKIDINMQKYRENAAISSLADLKELTLIFDLDYGVRNATTLFSHVTPFYGFQCLPDLKVTCAGSRNNTCSDKIREMVRPIEQYVDFIPNYEEPQDLEEKYLV